MIILFPTVNLLTILAYYRMITLIWVDLTQTYNIFSLSQICIQLWVVTGYTWNDWNSSKLNSLNLFIRSFYRTHLIRCGGINPVYCVICHFSPLYAIQTIWVSGCNYFDRRQTWQTTNIPPESDPSKTTQRQWLKPPVQTASITISND